MMRSGPSAGTTRCVRDGLGGNEWVLLNLFPDNIGGNPSVPQVTNYRPSKSADALGDGLRRLGRRDSNLCIPESKFAEDFGLGGGIRTSAY